MKHTVVIFLIFLTSCVVDHKVPPIKVEKIEIEHKISPIVIKMPWGSEAKIFALVHDSSRRRTGP